MAVLTSGALSSPLTFYDLLGRMPAGILGPPTPDPGAARPAGNVTLVSGPAPCSDPSKTCYTVSVDCPQLAQNINATLHVGGPSPPPRGTIVFLSGWDGTYLWAWSGSVRNEIVDDLETLGYGTVQVVWASNWWDGAAGQEEGYGKLACRPASVVEWIYTNIHPAPTQAFCATGHSNGASQIGYALAQYGLSDILDHVLFESGPNYARLDHGCLYDAANAELYYSSGRNHVDMSFGLDVSGPCFTNDTNYRSEFEQASLAYGSSWDYAYPTTSVSFIFGSNDGGTTAAHGLFHHNTVVAARSPLVDMQVIDGAGHDVGDYDPMSGESGKDAIKQILQDKCHVQSLKYFLGDREPGSARRWPGVGSR
jgi:hypothetical protein